MAEIHGGTIAARQLKAAGIDTVAFDRAGFLYVTLGDRGEQDRAQKPDDHAGSVIRLHDDGRVPTDNPFAKQANAKAETFSVGNRNVQGAALHPQTGLLWTHEHGPQGGDEVNLEADYLAKLVKRFVERLPAGAGLP